MENIVKIYLVKYKTKSWQNKCITIIANYHYQRNTNLVYTNQSTNH